MAISPLLYLTALGLNTMVSSLMAITVAVSARTASASMMLEGRSSTMTLLSPAFTVMLRRISSYPSRLTVTSARPAGTFRMVKRPLSPTTAYSVSFRASGTTITTAPVPGASSSSSLSARSVTVPVRVPRWMRCWAWREKTDKMIASREAILFMDTVLGFSPSLYAKIRPPDDVRRPCQSNFTNYLYRKRLMLIFGVFSKGTSTVSTLAILL